MQDYDFEKFLTEIVGADSAELQDSVNQSIADEISKRPHIRLNDDLSYIKNTYEYFKKTPIHFLEPKLPKETFNEKIASYIALNQLKTSIGSEIADSEVKEFLIENGYIDESGLTAKGERYFNSIRWVGHYLTFLDSFDFYEFEDYLNNSGEEFMPTALKFLNTHFDLALKRNDFKALFVAQSSKALYHAINKNLENALIEEMKLFIVRLNPNCENHQLTFHEAINQVNILNLNSLIVVCEITDIEMLFNGAWESLKYDKLYFDKKSSFDLLIRALTTTDLDIINKDIEDAYFKSGN